MEKLKAILVKIFAWWQGATPGTLLHTRRFGTEVGSDEFGNVYYKGGVDEEGYERRWVLYAGENDPTTVPPGWHGWMHHRTDIPPTEEPWVQPEWVKPHKPNMTGTALAYRPPGSLLNPEPREKTGSEYDAWTPGG